MSVDDLWSDKSRKVRNPQKEAVVNLKAWVTQPMEESLTKALIKRSTSPFASSIEFADICVTRRDKKPKISGGIMKDFETEVFSAQNGVSSLYDGPLPPVVPGAPPAVPTYLAKWVSAMETHIPLGIAAYNSESGDPTQEYVGMPYIAVHAFGVVTIVNTSGEDWKPGDRIIARFCWSEEDEKDILRRKPESDKEAPDRVPFVVERYDSMKHGWKFIGAKLLTAVILLAPLAGAGAGAEAERRATLRASVGTHIYNIWFILSKLMGGGYITAAGLGSARSDKVETIAKLLLGDPTTLTTIDGGTYRGFKDSLKWFGGPFDLIWRDWTLGTCNGYIPFGDNGEITLGIGKY